MTILCPIGQRDNIEFSTLFLFPDASKGGLIHICHLYFGIFSYITFQYFEHLFFAMISVACTINFHFEFLWCMLDELPL